MRRLEPIGLVAWAVIGVLLWLFWSAVIKIVIEVMK